MTVKTLMKDDGEGVDKKITVKVLMNDDNVGVVGAIVERNIGGTMLILKNCGHYC